MSIELRHAWLQKHPSPSATAGEFHWHSEAPASPEDAALRGRVVEELQGLAAPAAWWEVAPRRVIWAAVFSAISPADARPYRGVALTIATGPSSAADLLAQLRLAAPAPFTAASASAAGSATGPRPASGHDAELARALLSGGAATDDDPHDARLPAALAQLARALPAPLPERPLSGQITDAATTMVPHQGDDGVAELLSRVGRGDAQAEAAWRLLCELAQSDARAGAAAGPLRAEVVTALLDELWGESRLARDVRFPDRVTQRFAAQRRALMEGRRQAAEPASWRQLLHAWGRGWLGDEDALTARLAEELALRALAELCGGGQAQTALAEARWHALLPAARRRALWRELAGRAPCLADEAPFPRPPPPAAFATGEPHAP